MEYYRRRQTTDAYEWPVINWNVRYSFAVNFNWIRRHFASANFLPKSSWWTLRSSVLWIGVRVRTCPPPARRWTKLSAREVTIIRCWKLSCVGMPSCKILLLLLVTNACAWMRRWDRCRGNVTFWRWLQTASFAMPSNYNRWETLYRNHTCSWCYAWKLYVCASNLRFELHFDEFWVLRILAIRLYVLPFCVFLQTRLHKVSGIVEKACWQSACLFSSATNTCYRRPTVVAEVGYYLCLSVCFVCFSARYHLKNWCSIGLGYQTWHRNVPRLVLETYILGQKVEVTSHKTLPAWVFALLWVLASSSLFLYSSITTSIILPCFCRAVFLYANPFLYFILFQWFLPKYV